MSHDEYISGCDEDQLRSLIEKANARIEQIRKSGWVKLWTVSLNWANVGWFTEENYAEAVAFALLQVQQEAVDQRTKGVELEIKLEKYRPEEVPELLTRAPAPDALAAAPQAAPAHQ